MGGKEGKGWLDGTLFWGLCYGISLRSGGVVGVVGGRRGCRRRTTTLARDSHRVGFFELTVVSATLGVGVVGLGGKANGWATGATMHMGPLLGSR